MEYGDDAIENEFRWWQNLQKSEDAERARYAKMSNEELKIDDWRRRVRAIDQDHKFIELNLKKLDRERKKLMSETEDYRYEYLMKNRLTLVEKMCEKCQKVRKHWKVWCECCKPWAWHTHQDFVFQRTSPTRYMEVCEAALEGSPTNCLVCQLQPQITH